MKPLLVVFGVLALSLLLVGGCGVGIYNGIVSKDERTTAAWTEIQNQYQRRFDLVPQLVETVKGAANFEQSTLNENLRAAGLNVVIENLEIAAKELGDQSAHQPKAAAVLQKLAKLQEPDPFADRNLADVFDLPLPGVQQPIQFRRVEPTDGSRPFYLGTREVTLGQFAGALDGLRLWDEAPGGERQLITRWTSASGVQSGQRTAPTGTPATNLATVVGVPAAVV